MHGGLRYLAHGQVGVAHESAVERGILMSRTAPHLTRALPMLMPLQPRASAAARPRLARAGLPAGDLLRLAARTPPRRAPPAAPDLGAPRRSTLAPGAARRRAARRAARPGTASSRTTPGWSSAIARTAAAHGARVLTRTRVTELTGAGAVLRDELTGATRDDPAPARSSTPPACGPASLVARRPAAPQSRGTHLVLRADDAARAAACAVMAPVPGRDATASCSRCRSPTGRSTSASPTSRSTATSPTCRRRPRPRSTSCST